jgi:prepilin-type processing-associated H-X9-DG protein
VDTIPGQPALQNQNIYLPGGTRNTSIDMYRHGTYPPLASTTAFMPTGGKVAFNVLYTDGHVTTATDRETAYRCVRMRFPL